MAHCSRCNKFLLFNSRSGYCKVCEDVIQKESRRRAEEERKRQEEEARRKAEEERKRQEEEARRKAEEERKRQEEARRKAEEERKRQKEEARRKAEEERKRQEEEARRKAEEEWKRQEEEAQRKAEEDGKRQEPIIAAFISFPLKGNIHFGDSLQSVISKETKGVIAGESDSTHVVFPGAVTSIPGGKTYYSFAEDGSGLKGMSYTYYRVFTRDPYDMSGSSAVDKTANILLTGLKKKYGNPVFDGSMVLRLYGKIKGAEYQYLISNADDYSGSNIWGKFGLFSSDDAKREGITVSQLSDLKINSKDIKAKTYEDKKYLSNLGWIIPVDGNYVVIQFVVDRRFTSFIYINGELTGTIKSPFWLPGKDDYFVPVREGRSDLQIHFMDLVYVRYTKDEFNRLMDAQQKSEELAAKQAAEKEERFLNEL